jgi:S1-C subfamily serine protease
MRESENTDSRESLHAAAGSAPTAQLEAGSPPAAELDDAGSAPSAGLQAGSAPPAGDDFPSDGADPGRGVRLVAYLAAGALALGVGFGLTRLVNPPRAVPLSAVIPSPATSGGVFVEDDDGTGQDSQDNIFATTVPGLVHIMSAGQAVGIGLVLTPSGKVLTTYQPSGAGSGLSAKYLASGAAFKATVIGTDPAAGLALLQMEGGNGGAFPTLAVGNSDALAQNAYDSKQLSYHLPGEVMDTAVGTTGTRDAVIINTGVLIALNQTVTVAGKARTGLMQSRLQSVSEGDIGGPLVNLAGQVIGITVAGDGTGLKVIGYAMPINQVLGVANQIDVRARHTS